LAATAVCSIIENKNINNTIIAVLIFIYPKKVKEKSAATAVYNLIENKNINNTIIAFSILYVTKKVREKSLNWISTSSTPNLHSV
jgi:hypothetical protein